MKMLRLQSRQISSAPSEQGIIENNKYYTTPRVPSVEKYTKVTRLDLSGNLGMILWTSPRFLKVRVYE